MTLRLAALLVASAAAWYLGGLAEDLLGLEVLDPLGSVCAVFVILTVAHRLPRLG